MHIDANAAETSLADIDMMVARLKRSSFYRGASSLIIVWGGLVAFGYTACTFLTRDALWIWLAVNSLGVLATLATGLQYRRSGKAFEWRILVAILLFFAFGLITSYIGHFGGREYSAFWPILFMFGYALAGLWLGRAFIVLGVSIAALTFAGTSGSNHGSSFISLSSRAAD
jgi:hypothetical protein